MSMSWSTLKSYSPFSHDNLSCYPEKSAFCFLEITDLFIRRKQALLSQNNEIINLRSQDNGIKTVSMAKLLLCLFIIVCSCFYNCVILQNDISWMQLHFYITISYGQMEPCCPPKKRDYFLGPKNDICLYSVIKLSSRHNNHHEEIRGLIIKPQSLQIL